MDHIKLHLITNYKKELTTHCAIRPCLKFHYRRAMGPEHYLLFFNLSAMSKVWTKLQVGHD